MEWISSENRTTGFISWRFTQKQLGIVSGQNGQLFNECFLCTNLCAFWIPEDVLEGYPWLFS